MFESAHPNHPALAAAIARHESASRPRLEKLWDYYRNPARPAPAHAHLHTLSHAPHAATLAQHRGLPARFQTSTRAASTDDRAWARKEIVIENDIAWRIHTMVDFMFGRPVSIVSTARDEHTRLRIQLVLDALWEASGGIALLHDIGLLGHIYGHVDLVLRSRRTPSDSEGPETLRTLDPAQAAAHHLRIECIEPTRGFPILNPRDYRHLAAYLIRSRSAAPLSTTRAPQPPSFLSRWLSLDAPINTASPDLITTELFTPTHHRVFEQLGAHAQPRLIHESPIEPGAPRLPIVHIQNIAQPFSYEGLGEVEPLIPLQDELNTRLSDRASRVTFQSFKMLLAKGIDGMDKVPVGPGQVWVTDNPDAEVQSIGGDAASPSEDRHIEEIREAMDKASGVPPLAAGVVRAKIGNLTSENALRVTLMGLLSKTARKRITYGRGLAEASRLALDALDRAGILTTDPADRAVRIDWPDPLPQEEERALANALRKVELGIPRQRVLSELGYAPTDPGIV